MNVIWPVSSRMLESDVNGGDLPFRADVSFKYKTYRWEWETTVTRGPRMCQIYAREGQKANYISELFQFVSSVKRHARPSKGYLKIPETEQNITRLTAGATVALSTVESPWNGHGTECYLMGTV